MNTETEMPVNPLNLYTKNLFFRLLILDGLILLVLLAIRRDWLFSALAGMLIGAFWLWSLYQTVLLTGSGGKQALAIGLALSRWSGTAMLIVLAGRFQVEETLVVICCFLSYKLVYILDGISFVLGFLRRRGK